jgi:hypothetical protein
MLIRGGTAARYLMEFTSRFWSSSSSSAARPATDGSSAASITAPLSTTDERITARALSRAAPRLTA